MQQKQQCPSECVTLLRLQPHNPTAITSFWKLLFSPPFTLWITFLLTLITSWVFPSHSRFDLVITPTSSSSSACLLTFTITPSLTSSHTACLQQLKCHHPSNFSFNSLERLPLPALTPRCSTAQCLRSALTDKAVRAHVWPKLYDDTCETFSWSLGTHRWTHWTVLSCLFWPE